MSRSRPDGPASRRDEATSPPLAGGAVAPRGPAPPPPVVRRPADVRRVALGSVVLAAGAAVASRPRLGRFEADVFRSVNHLPDALYWPVALVMQAGTLAAVAAAAGAAVVARRPRLARGLAASGTLAYFGAKAAKAAVGRGRPGVLLEAVLFRGAPEAGLGFPSGHTAVAAALATAAAPYLGRRARRLARAGVAVVAAARIYVGAHLPVDVVGGAALGWMAGAIFHLLWGAPDDEKPTPEEHPRP